MSLYLTLAEVLAMQRVLIDRYSGLHGVRDMGALESAVFRPQSGYYDDIIQEAASLLESLAINHPFLDGNKRIAFAAADVFLHMNGYRITASSDAIYAFLIALFEEDRFEMQHLEAYLREHTKQIH